MKVLYSPQFNPEERIIYTFNGEVVSIEHNEIIEVVDFTNMPDGKADSIEMEDLEFSPIISAERVDGELYLVLLNFYGEKEGNNKTPHEVLFPTWQEVCKDGEDNLGK